MHYGFQLLLLAIFFEEVDTDFALHEKCMIIEKL